MTFLFLAIVGIIMAGGLALVFWPDRFTKEERQVAFGTSLATSAVISLAFFALQNENQQDQDRLARKQTFQISIALQRDLSHTDLQGADLRHLNLAGKNLSGADMRGADLSKDDLTRTNLSGAVLAGANLQHTILTDANLSGARMQGADLRDAELRRANLSGAIIGGPAGSASEQAHLARARFIDARASGACLAHVDMRDAQFGGADLRNAVLTGADLRGAQLQVDGVFANVGHAAGIASARLDPRTRATLLSAAVGSVNAASPPVPQDARWDRIAEVSDGDTLRLASGRWMRLAGVDAWTTDQPEGKRAADFLAQLQRRSPEIRFALGDPPEEAFRNKVNPPGRLRAYVWLSDGTFLNATLLAKGYADRQYPNPVHDDDPTESGYTTVLEQARDRARETGRGIWSTCPRMPSSSAAQNTTGPALVERAGLAGTATAAAPWRAGPDRPIRPAPRQRQPIGGLSAVVALGPERFLALTDNGFGKRRNSQSFLLRVYTVRADFRTRSGGRGRLEVERFVTLRDPHHRVPFRLSTAGTKRRLLTGRDFDPESLALDRHGDLWIGDEFGPYVLHFDKAGVLLGPPIALPGVKSPDNVARSARTRALTLRSSQGIEGLALSPTGDRLYAALEGQLLTDVDARRRILFEYDVVDSQFTGRRWYYRVAAPGNGVADLAALDGDHLLLLEKANAPRPARPFARVFEVDLRRADPHGYLQQRQVLDLLNVKDPHQISMTVGKQGERPRTRYSAPGGVEGIVKIGTHELGVLDDNNLVARRRAGLTSESELAIIALPERFGA